MSAINLVVIIGLSGLSGFVFGGNGENLKSSEVISDEFVKKSVDIFPDLPLGVINGKNVLCREQTRMYTENIRNMSLWAYEMRDATAKSVQGILRGSIFQFGHFEECLSAKAPFPTQYCLASLVADVPPPNPPRDPKSLEYSSNENVMRKIYDHKDPSQQPENIVLMGWCVPATCTHVDLELHLNEYLRNAQTVFKDQNVTYVSHISENSCQTENEKQYLDHIDISFWLPGFVKLVANVTNFNAKYLSIFSTSIVLFCALINYVSVSDPLVFEIFDFIFFQGQQPTIEIKGLNTNQCLVTLIIVVLVIGSTFCDIAWKHEDKLFGSYPLQKLVTSFSIRKNYYKLAKSEDSNSALKVLYGMRMLCIFMIIIDHRFGTFLSIGILNFNTVEQNYRTTFGTLFFHGDLFVDSFFILSGILVTYCLLVQFEKNILNPAIIVIMRYVRLTPLYAYVLFFCSTLFDFTGNGPMWKTVVTPEVQDCRQNWWTNLLYVSNYVNAERMCMVHTWYLPCDFHYFILAIPLCIAIHKNKKVGLTLLGLTTIVSILIPFSITYMHSRPAVLFFYLDFIRSPKTHTDYLFTYTKSHIRAAPYFVGMIAGYLFYRMRQKKQNLGVAASYFIFIISIIMMIGSIVTGVIFYDPYYKYDALESALYAALHRVVWSLGSIGALYVSSYGQVKWVYNFLAWKPWVSLSKLVFGAYLVHFQFALRATAQKSGADNVSYYDIISYALSDVVLAFGTAFVLFLMIEAPFRNIFSLLFFNTKEREPKKGPEDSSSESSHL